MPKFLVSVTRYATVIQEAEWEGEAASENDALDAFYDADDRTWRVIKVIDCDTLDTEIEEIT